MPSDKARQASGGAVSSLDQALSTPGEAIPALGEALSGADKVFPTLGKTVSSRVKTAFPKVVTTPPSHKPTDQPLAEMCLCVSLPSVELSTVVADVTDEVLAIDVSGIPFKQFAPGVGPYGEPQLVKAIASGLRTKLGYKGTVTKRTPDMLIPGSWALEFKIARPFGDNGKEAENWSVNLLHPYEGNVSVIGDCLKLREYAGPERRGVVVVGYEHMPTVIDLSPLFAGFEVIAEQVIGVKLGERIEERRGPLVHPVHQQLVVVAWEVLG